MNSIRLDMTCDNEIYFNYLIYANHVQKEIINVMVLRLVETWLHINNTNRLSTNRKQKLSIFGAHKPLNCTHKLCGTYKTKTKLSENNP